MDDFDDEDTMSLIEETRKKTIEIFGEIDCCSRAEASEEKQEIGNHTTGRRSTAFIPLSAKNAFTYRKAGNIAIDKLDDPKHRDM